MGKRFFVLFLSLCVMLFAVSGAVGNDWETETTANGGTYTLTYDFDGDDIEEIDEDYDAVAGHNFRVRYRLPALVLTAGFDFVHNTNDDYDADGEFTLSQDKCTFAWDIKGTTFSTDLISSDLFFTFDKDDSGDLVVLSGLLPDSDDTYTISFDLVATISAIDVTGVTLSDNATSNSNYLKQITGNVAGTSFDSEITIIVGKDEDKASRVLSGASFDTYVKAAEGVKLNVVSSDYAVTVSVPATPEETPLGTEYVYNLFIASEDEQPQLPAWLYIKDMKTATVDDETQIVSLDIALSPDVKAAKGEKGRVFITISDLEYNTFTVCWNVAYDPDKEEPRPFGVSGSEEVNFTFTEPSTSQSQDITYTGSAPVRYQASGDIAGFTGDMLAVTSTDTDEFTGNGTITVTVTIPATVDPSITYTGSLIFFDALGNSDDIACNVTIDITGGDDTELELELSTDTMEIMPGNSESVTATANKPVASWEVSADEDVFSYTIESTDISADITITVLDNAEDGEYKDGEYTVTITATDMYGNEASEDIAVTVFSDGADYYIALDPKENPYEIAQGASTIVLISNRGRASGDITWDISDAPVGLTYGPVVSDDHGVNFEIRVDSDATTGLKDTITVTATDEAGNSGTATITVTVTSSGGGTPDPGDDISEDLKEAITELFGEEESSHIARLKPEDLTAPSDTASIIAEYEDTGETVILILPEIPASAITESGVYVYDVNFADLQASVDNGALNYGDPLFVHARPQGDAEDEAKLLNDAGEVIEVMPAADGGVNVAAYLVSGVTYSPVITAKVGGGDDTELEIELSTNTMELKPGESDGVIATANKPVSWDVSADLKVFSYEWEYRDISADITVTARASAEDGEYPVTITATDAAGNKVSEDVTVTVTSGGESGYSVVLDPKESSITIAQGSSDSVTIANTGTPSGDVTWISSSAPMGLTISFTASSDTSATVKISADATAATGNKDISIIATDAAGNSDDAIITVTVTGGEPVYSVTLSPKTNPLTMRQDSFSTVTISNTSTPSGKVTWTSSSAPEGLTVAITTSDNASATVRVTVDSDATTGAKDPITITATDEAGNTDSATITVTVTGSGPSPDPGDDDDISETLKEAITELFGDKASNVARLSSEGLTTPSDTASIIAEYEDTGETVILILPEIPASAITESGVYVYDVNFADLQASVDNGALNYGDPLFVHARPQTTADDKATLLNDNGEEIEVMPTTDGGVHVAAYLEAGITYSPVITAEVGGSDETELELTLSGATMTLTPGESKVVTATANKSVASWEVSADEDISFTIASTDVSADITLTAGDDASGEYTVTITATDSDGNEASKDVTVTVSSSTTEYSVELTPEDTPLTIRQGSANSATIRNTGAPSGSVTWTLSSAPSGLAVEITASSDTSATVRVAVDSTATTGARDPITITATDEAGNSGTATITVTVASSSSTGSVTLTPRANPLTIAQGNSGSVTISNVGSPSGSVTWTHSSAPTGLAVEITTSDNYSATVRVTVDSTATAGVKDSITITATDEGGNTDSATITVTVTESGGGDDTDSKQDYLDNNSGAEAKTTDEEVFEAIKDAVKQFFSDVNAAVGRLLDTAIGASQKVTSELQAEYADTNETPVAALNTVAVSENGIFVFAIDYSELLEAVTARLLSVGDPLYVHMRPDDTDTTSGGSVSAAAEDDLGVLIDDDGNEIKVMPETNNGINIAAYLEAGTTYYPVITTASGDSKLGPSGAGCNGGFGSLFGLLGLAFTASALYLRKRS